MFIVIDGPDGSGKTTLAKCLSKALCSNGIRTIYTSEPTLNSKTGNKIQRVLKNKESIATQDLTELFLEDRKEHLINVVQPHLYSGTWVVCDRYKYSALAYQQVQGLDAKYLIEQHQQCLVPDIIFILIPSSVSVLLDRIKERGKKKDLFENEEMLERVIYYYKNIKKYFPDENIRYLNADVSTKENLKLVGRCLGVSKLLNDEDDGII